MNKKILKLNIILLIITMFISSCSNHRNIKYKINNIQLQDSIKHTKIFEKTVGIPTSSETRYVYKLQLSNEVSDTIIKVKLRNKIDETKFIGDSIVIRKNF